MSIEATVSTALALQNFNVHQETQMNLLRQTLDNRARVVSEIIESAAPKLATTGNLGTRINTYA